MEEPPGRLVEARDLAAIEDDGLERGERPAELAELAVAGDLDPEHEPLSGRRGAAEHRLAAVAGRPRPGIQALHALAVDPQRRLAVAREAQVDPLAGPRVGHDRGDVEPVRAP